MAINPNFYLKTPKENDSLIFMAIRLNKTTLFKYYFKVKVITELFDPTTQRTTSNKEKIKQYLISNPNIKQQLKLIDTTLNNIENDTSRIVDDLIRYDKIVTPEKLKERLDEIYKPHLNKSKIKKSITFNNYLDEFISECSSGIKLHNTKKYTLGTIKTYKTFRNTINSFKQNINFDDINLEFYKKFVMFLNAKNYTLNSVGKNIKFIKVIMKDALEKGLHNNLQYTHKEFKSLNIKTDSVYLTEQELNLLYDIDLKGKPNYELARDVFVIGCYTALRYSDYSRLKKENIKTKDGRNYIEIYTQKTNELVMIPIKPKVYTILEKYDFNLPKTHEQKVNLYIKEVCKMLNITQPTEIKSTVAGVVNVSFKPKNELIKTHTARRTGATLLYLAGVPPIDIMKITGHTKISNLLNYICITKEETAERLSENKFFS